MKCRVCRGPAVIDVRRHNANFCGDHFVEHCRRQVERAIAEHDMLEPESRVLVAVSGGKDSLAVWELLGDLGHRADGLYLGLGIGAYSERSRRITEDFASDRGLALQVVDLPTDLGYDIPTGARAAKRAPCSACGLSKRHLFDRAALEGGYDAVVTGHNLDDEAAVLFGNVLHWDTEYLARQAPVLPAGNGFPRKVKPLVRLAERETAAYCVIRGIDYVVEECPMSAGNRHLGYKEALNFVEETSPGTKAAFYGGFLARAADRFTTDDTGASLGACARCGAPSSNEVCAFCALVERASAPVRLVEKPPALSRLLRVGELVLLIDQKQRRYLVTLAEGGEFHSHAGVTAHDDLIGRPEGASARSSRGATVVALRPTLADYVLKMPRGAQVIYPKDLGPILLLADVFPGARVLESGVGSGALSMTMLRAGAEVVGYELRDDFASRATKNVAEFLGPDALDRYRVELRDCYEGIDETDIDRVVLDLPEPWQVVEHAAEALHPGGILVAYTPTITQAARLRRELEHSAFSMAETEEYLRRTWHVEGQSVRPDHRMIAHTGFLTKARLLP